MALRESSKQPQRKWDKGARLSRSRRMPAWSMRHSRLIAPMPAYMPWKVKGRLLFCFSRFSPVVRIGQTDQKIHVIILLRAIVLFCTANGTLVSDHKSLFGMGQYCMRLHQAAANAGAVSGKFIHVKRPQAIRTVISRGIYQGRNLFFAVTADKSAVVFGKSLRFHKKTSQKFTNSLYFWVQLRV